LPIAQDGAIHAPKKCSGTCGDDATVLSGRGLRFPRIAPVEISLHEPKNVSSMLTLPTPQEQIMLFIKAANQLILFNPRFSPDCFTCTFDQDERRTILCANIEREWHPIVKGPKVFRFENERAR
jgi:hypothetical protein